MNIDSMCIEKYMYRFILIHMYIYDYIRVRISKWYNQACMQGEQCTSSPANLMNSNFSPVQKCAKRQGLGLHCLHESPDLQCFVSILFYIVSMLLSAHLWLPRKSLHLGPSSCSSCNLMCSCRVHACAFRKARTNSALEGLSSAFTVNERTKNDNKGYTENEQRNIDINYLI